MTERYRLHDKHSAPQDSVGYLDKAEKTLGKIPNLERVMANAPALLAGYVQLWDLFDNSSLDPVERQVVYQTVNFENECNYCVPWHTKLARLAGMQEQDVEALRDGQTLSTPRLEALRQFTQSLVRTRGKISQADLDRFQQADFSDQQALEIILGVAVKIMSNYTNSVAGTPLDKEVADLAWVKPVIKPRQP